MPRKTDGIVYELNTLPPKEEGGKKPLYAEPVITVTYDTKGLDEYCHKYGYCGLNEVQNILNTACEAVATLVSKGCRVQTPFGSFAPKLKLLGEHTDPDKVTGKDIVYNGIEFIPSKAFKEAADCSKHGFRKPDPSIWKPKKVEGEEALLEAMYKSVHHGYTTVQWFMNKSGLKATASREYLDALCKGESALLYRNKLGNTIQYYLRQPLPPVEK